MGTILIMGIDRHYGRLLGRYGNNAKKPVVWGIIYQENGLIYFFADEDIPCKTFYNDDSEGITIYNHKV